MQKEQIELRLQELESKKAENVQEITDLKDKLEELNSPTITEEQAEELNERLCTHIDAIDFSDCDNYNDFEFEIDYDNRIRVSHCDPSDLISSIKDEFQEIISDFFKVKREE